MERMTDGDLFGLFERWTAWADWWRIRGHAQARGDAHGVAVAEGTLADAGEVDHLEALAAARELGRRLEAWRPDMVRAAREAGVSWARIGDAVGVTRQAVWEQYRDYVDQQTDIANRLDLPFDAGRARAALGESPEGVG